MESPTSLLAAAALRSSPPPRVPRPRRPRPGLTLAGLIAVLTAALAPAADAETRSLRLLSDDPFRTDPALGARFLYESVDGSRAFFQTSEQLANTDTDDSNDVYERGPAGPILLSDGEGADADESSRFSHGSDDGTRVYFTTPESLSAADTDAVDDVYVSTAVATPATPRPADRVAPTVSRVKVARSGRVRRRARGRYRVTLTATDAAGNRSAPRRVSVRTKRAR